MEKIIEKLKDGIAEAINHQDNLDSASWGNQEGILITANEAKAVLEALKVLESNVDKGYVLGTKSHNEIRGEWFEYLVKIAKGVNLYRTTLTENINNALVFKTKQEAKQWIKTYGIHTFNFEIIKLLLADSVSSSEMT